MGIACLICFVLLGPWLGEVMFHSALAGRCIRTLGWICPFLYLDVTLSSILQGLGKAGTIFGINVLSLLVRLSFVYLAIPLFGIRGYLWGMLAGQLLLTLLYGICLYQFFKRPCTQD
jgi:stage V sporulation protein B